MSSRRAEPLTLIVVSGAPGTGNSVAEGWWRGPRRDRAVAEFAELAATVTPLRLGGPLVEVDTGKPGACAEAVTAARAAIG